MNLGAAIVVSVLLISLLARFLPSLPIFRRLFLSAQSSTGPSFPLLSAKSSDVVAGQTGVAQTTLRPAGKALIGSALLDVVTDGQFLDRGTPIRVLSVAGDRIVVEPV